jgi:hypothetical protein
MSLWQSARAIAACLTLTITPLTSHAAMIVAPDREKHYGPIHFHPNSITIGLGLGQSGSASFRVSQRRYDGRFRGTIQCALGLLGKPRLDIDGHTVTVIVPPQNAVLSVGCYATIEGGGGVTGQEPILIDVGFD